MDPFENLMLFEILSFERIIYLCNLPCLQRVLWLLQQSYFFEVVEALSHIADVIPCIVSPDFKQQCRGWMKDPLTDGFRTVESCDTST